LFFNSQPSTEPTSSKIKKVDSSQKEELKSPRCQSLPKRLSLRI
jgi:hypothetical protein